MVKNYANTHICNNEGYFVYLIEPVQTSGFETIRERILNPHILERSSVYLKTILGSRIKLFFGNLLYYFTDLSGKLNDTKAHWPKHGFINKYSNEAMQSFHYGLSSI